MSLPSTTDVIASSYSCVRALFLVPPPAFIAKGDQKIMNIPSMLRQRLKKLRSGADGIELT